MIACEFCNFVEWMDFSGEDGPCMISQQALSCNIHAINVLGAWAGSRHYVHVTRPWHYVDVGSKSLRLARKWAENLAANLVFLNNGDA